MNVFATDTRYGTILYNERDPFFRDALTKYGEWAWCEAQFWQRLVAPGDVVISGGANIGCHVITLAKLVGRSGAVFAFEPQLPLWQICTANAAIANVGEWARPVHAALGAENGIIQMPLPDYERETSFGGLSLRHTAVPDDAPRYPVKQMTIDSLDLARCSFIQLDIEGMEDEALRGAKDTIARCQPVLYLETDYPAAKIALHKRMERIGYRAFWHIVPFYNPANFKGNRENIWPGAVINSWLCVPEHRAEAIALPPVTDPMRPPHA